MHDKFHVSITHSILLFGLPIWNCVLQIMKLVLNRATKEYLKLTLKFNKHDFYSDLIDTSIMIN